VQGFYEVESYSTLVKSDKVTPESESINGISTKMLESAPTFEQIEHTLYNLLNDRIWAGYNIASEAHYIKKCFQRLKHMEPAPAGTLDTAPILKEHFGGRAGGETKLDSLGQ
jgi:DNA polymerase III epsilon subunit-like protein